MSTVERIQEKQFSKSFWVNQSMTMFEWLKKSRIPPIVVDR